MVCSPAKTSSAALPVYCQMLIRAMDGMAWSGEPRKGGGVRLRARKTEPIGPRPGLRIQAQMVPTMTAGSSQGRMKTLRSRVDLTTRSIITARRMARMV